MTLLKSAILLAALACPVSAFAGDLTIDLKDVKAANGDVYISLQKQDEFMKNAGSYGTIIKAPKSGDHAVTLKNVAPGDYHIGVWHDIDGDNKFSMGADYMPTDGWSSFKAETLRAAPTWEQVKYTVAQDAASVTLKMVYHP